MILYRKENFSVPFLKPWNYFDLRSFRKLLDSSQENLFVACWDTVLYGCANPQKLWKHLSDAPISPPFLALGPRISSRKPSLTMTLWRTWSCRRSRRLWIVCTQWSTAKTVASSKKEMWARWCMSWKVWFLTLLLWKPSISFSSYQLAYRLVRQFCFSLFLLRNSLKRGGTPLSY